MVDITKQQDGRWMIMELEDGQVASLPERLPPDDLYQQLRNVYFD